VLTAVGVVEVSRPYYLCTACHEGQFPTDQELDIVQTEFSPGVRRMQALVGQDASFDHGREQMKLLAGLEVTTKSVERVAESIGADIARQQQEEIHRAVQLDLPIILGEATPILYVQMDGTGVPVVKKETEGRKGKLDGLPAHTREAKLGCVFTQAQWDSHGYAIRDPHSTTYTGGVENAEQFGKRLCVEACQSSEGGVFSNVAFSAGTHTLRFDVYQVGSDTNQPNNPFGLLYTGTAEASAVPAPGTYALPGAGLVGLAASRRRGLIKA
jgi:hypothetical protein